MQKIAVDLIDGTRDWEDITTTYRKDSNLVQWCIWFISFGSWFPIFNLLLSIAEYEGLKLKYLEKNGCANIDFKNELVQIPLCLFPFIVLFQYIFVQRNSKLNFRYKIKIFLLTLYVCSILKYMERFGIKYIYGHKSSADLSTTDKVLIWILELTSVLIMAGMSLSHLFIQYKL